MGVRSEIVHAGPGDPDHPPGTVIEIIPDSRTREEAEAEARARIAAARWDAETASVSIGGLAIQADRESRGILAQAVQLADMGALTEARWKAADGSFVTLTADQLRGAMMALAAHVQARFDQERSRLAEIAAATTNDEIDEVSW